MYNNIFISYASEDLKYADSLYEFLLDNGYIPWLDKRNLLPGQNWNSEIHNALREAHFIIMLISQTSVSKRGYIQREFKLALDYCNEKLDSDIYIIPVKIDNCDVPNELSKFQWVEYSKKDTKKKILESLKYQRLTIVKAKAKDLQRKLTDGD